MPKSRGLRRLPLLTCISPYPIEKVRDSPYPYLYSVNAGILCQNGNRFGQYR